MPPPAHSSPEAYPHGHSAMTMSPMSWPSLRQTPSVFHRRPHPRHHVSPCCAVSSVAPPNNPANCTLPPHRGTTESLRCLRVSLDCSQPRRPSSPATTEGSERWGCKRVTQPWDDVFRRVAHTQEGQRWMMTTAPPRALGAERETPKNTSTLPPLRTLIGAAPLELSAADVRPGVPIALFQTRMDQGEPYTGT